MNLFIKYKKLFLVFGFIAITIFLGWILYKTFFQTNLAISPEISTSTPNRGGLPSSDNGGSQIVTSTAPGTIPGNADNSTSNPNNPLVSNQPDNNAPSNLALGGLTKVETLTTSPGIGSTLSAAGGVQYYNKDDGYFYKIDTSGQVTKMSDRVFHDVSNIVWAPSKNKAILEYPDGSKILYNFDTKKQVTYPKYWENFSFSPQSDQVVAKSIGLDPSNRFLTVSSEDGSRAVNVTPIGTNETVQASWSPNNQIVATYSKGLDFDRQEVFFVGLNGENFKSTIVEGRGLNYTWSTTGDRLLYSVYNANSDMKPKLWIVDAQGNTINENRHSLEINTWADKCTFASNTEIYCAVPVDLPSGAGLVREIADKSNDELYKINLETGVKQLVAVPNGNFNVSNLMVNSAQNQLVFSDKNTGLLYKVKLK
ncbi:MAG: hypothetical protein WCK59_01430 [Candidatus Falkowbacteria bacterium]